jgi:hypothetical protein
VTTLSVDLKACDIREKDLDDLLPKVFVVSNVESECPFLKRKGYSDRGHTATLMHYDLMFDSY